ncbi:unnamed protein product [Ceratitis capitata]|uniref:(Mediterranean fruit fly) hypothetical protein n=1 Tax=Ceratitis capitata TaxID=7213 RepID=A0A811VEY0_CERCA|nr:unnamed protein product [Ceratitis capitata]
MSEIHSERLTFPAEGRPQLENFWLNGCKSKQICRFCCEDQPEELQELTMHTEKVTVWYGLWAGGIIGPYFFKDDENRKVTVNAERYREMISNFFFAQNARS